MPGSAQESAVSYLVGTLDFPLQLHLILPLPQDLLAEGRQAWSGIFQLQEEQYRVNKNAV